MYLYFPDTPRTLDAGLLARSQYPEGPATGYLGTTFSWFSCVYKRMLRWFPRLQVATACFSCSPQDLNFLDPYFIFMYLHYNHCHRATAHLQLNILLYILLLLLLLLLLLFNLKLKQSSRNLLQCADTENCIQYVEKAETTEPTACNTPGGFSFVYYFLQIISI